MNCGASFLKCLMIFFNIIVFIAGLAIMIMGIVIIAKPDLVQGTLSKLSLDKELVQLLEQSYSINSFMIALTIFGAVLLLIGFLGCCGACTSSRFMLIVFCILNAVILIALLVCVIYMGVTKFEMPQSFSDQLRKDLDADLESIKQNCTDSQSFKQCNTGTKLGLLQTLTTSELWTTCCGVNGTKDYSGTAAIKSCHAEATTGCHEQFIKLLPKVYQQYKVPVIIVLVVIMILLLGAVLAGGVVSNAIKNDKYEA